MIDERPLWAARLYTSTKFSEKENPKKEINTVFSNQERETLRTLAEHVAELSCRPIENEKKDLWYRHNALESVRPLILCDPENGWNEIITEDQMLCQNNLARHWEFWLRQLIFWGESMNDDRVIEPYFDIPYVFIESDWGMQEKKIGGEGGGSYRWIAPMNDYSLIDELHFPQIEVDYEMTNHILSLAEDVVGNALKVRLKGMWWWSLGISEIAVYLRGLEQMMYDMYDHPEELHHLMRFLRDGILAKLDYLEKNNLLCLNNTGNYVGSGGMGYSHQLPQKDFDGSHVRPIDMWGFAESQPTVGVSPALYEEFIFPYEKSILDRFGLNCYGCCELINQRWEAVKRFLNLRRVSVSPWANREDMAQKLENRYIYSLKFNPSYLAVPNLDEKFIRQEIRRYLEITKGCVVEIIMKDNNTIGNNPQNVIRWSKIAREEAENFWL